MEDDLHTALKTLGHPVRWVAFDKDVGWPRMTLQRISTITKYTLDSRVDIETARIQVNVYAKSYPEVMALGRQVTDLLTAFKGGSVIRCYEMSRRDSLSESGGDVIRLQSLDFKVRYRA
mgnify:CR=1 FL=1